MNHPENMDSVIYGGHHEEYLNQLTSNNNYSSSLTVLGI